MSKDGIIHHSIQTREVMQLKSNFVVLACLVVAGLSATVTTVTNDIAAIASQVATLDAAINSFTSGGQIGTALVSSILFCFLVQYANKCKGINTDSGNLVKVIQQTTTDVKVKKSKYPIFIPLNIPV